jgi:hypothetical protein
MQIEPYSIAICVAQSNAFGVCLLSRCASSGIGRLIQSVCPVRGHLDYPGHHPGLSTSVDSLADTFKEDFLRVAMQPFREIPALHIRKFGN